MDEKIKLLLYRSFEEMLRPDEQKILDQALASSNELRQERDEIVRLKEKLQHKKPVSFGPMFADKVMNRIYQSIYDPEDESFFDALIYIFRPVAIAAVLLIIMMSGYNLVSAGKFTIENVLGIPEVTLDDAYSTSVAALMEEGHEN